MFLKLALLATGIAGAYSQLTHTVQVGPSGLLVYDPPTVSAAVGDTVRYCFNPKNHSVTSSDFATPCQPNGMFDSGLTPVAEGSPEDCAQWFDVPINDPSPIWIHCKQPNGAHCQHGMVNAINAPASGSNTFEAFQAAAEALLNTATTTAPPSATTTPPSSSTDAAPPLASPPATHTITVGANHQKMFFPPNITAAQGDQVVFLFLADNHTTTQSNFNDPCESLLESTGIQGFDSGFEPIGPSNPNPATFTITVNTTEPMWGYCKQTGHCQMGMVWSINAPADGNTFDAFHAKAVALSSNSTLSGGSSNTSGALSTKSMSLVMMGLSVVVTAMS